MLLFDYFSHNLAISCYLNQILTVSLPENFNLGKSGQPQLIKSNKRDPQENLIFLKYQNLSLFRLALQSSRDALCAKH